MKRNMPLFWRDVEEAVKKYRKTIEVMKELSRKFEEEETE